MMAFSRSTKFPRSINHYKRVKHHYNLMNYIALVTLPRPCPTKMSLCHGLCKVMAHGERGALTFCVNPVQKFGSTDLPRLWRMASGAPSLSVLTLYKSLDLQIYPPALNIGLERYMCRGWMPRSHPEANPYQKILTETWKTHKPPADPGYSSGHTRPVMLLSEVFFSSTAE